MTDILCNVPVDALNRRIFLSQRNYDEVANDLDVLHPLVEAVAPFTIDLIVSEGVDDTAVVVDRGGTLMVYGARRGEWVVDIVEVDHDGSVADFLMRPAAP